MSVKLNDRHDAYRLLSSLGAPERLIVHVRLVGEAADLLIAQYREMGLDFDAEHIELGAAVHDAGKLLFPNELDGPGSQHEPAGEKLMLANGVQPHIARCCVSHAAWRASDLSFEERSVALADKLWKGKREEELELGVVDSIAEKLAVDRWDVFTRLDLAFEEIGAGAPDRLARSK